MKRHSILPMLLALAVMSCSDTEGDASREIVDIPRQQNTDAQPGGLFHDFVIDGKTDAAGHPVGAEVFKGAERCEPTTGIDAKVGIAAELRFDEAGVLCRAETQRLGDGTFALNTRALMTQSKSEALADETEILEISVFDLDGEELASRAVTAADFGELGAERDLAVTFRHRGDSPVRFEVRWTGVANARLTYVEVFRSTPRLVISPASQPLEVEAGPTFEIEMQDPPPNLGFEIYCNDLDISQTLVDLLDAGDAIWTDTEFRTLVEVPADLLFAECTTPARVTIRALSGEWQHKTSRVTYYDEPIPCAYVGNADGTRVLVTGFEPFPADSDRDNSSKEAVEAYVAGELPAGLSVMKAILPVEYDAAAELVEDMIDRCEPDVVVGFGQGRMVVDLETTAYNRKDTAAVAGGVPDNRGFVYGGAPIVEGGPAEMATGLPVDTILERLNGAGIMARQSSDPGRYICNNIFYATMNAVAQRPEKRGGFVHLPRIPYVGEAEREELRQTVAAVVESTVEVL